MAASGIKAGQAYVELYVDKSAMVRGLKSAGADLKAWGAGIATVGKGFLAAGLAIQAPLALAGHFFAETGSQLLLMSQRTGIAVDALASLRFAAVQSGVEAEDLETGIRHMNRAVIEAARGTGPASQAFARLGLTWRDLNGLTVDEQFEAIADAISELPNAQNRATLAMEIFGRHGTALLPILQRGAEGIRTLRAEANSPWNQQLAEQAHEAELAFGAVWRSIKAIGVVIGGTLAPAMTRTANLITTWLGRAREWISENKPLVQIIDYLGIGLIGAGVALIVLGKVVSGVGAGLAVFGSIIGTIAKVAVGVGFALVSAFTALFSPIGLIVALIGGGIAAFFTLTSAGRNAASSIGSGFRAIGATFADTWGGIRDAISAGDWTLAFEVGLAGIRTAWAQMIHGLTSAWRSFADTVADIWDDVTTDLAQGINNPQALAAQFASVMVGPFSDSLAQDLNQAARGLWANDPVHQELDTMREQQRQARAQAAAASDAAEQARIRELQDALNARIRDAAEAARNAVTVTTGEATLVPDLSGLGAEGRASTGGFGGVAAEQQLASPLSEVARNTAEISRNTAGLRNATGLAYT